MHAVVARSTFPSQKCQKLTVLDHFWKLRCRKSVHRCGKKHISKSKVSKTDSLGPLLDVEVSTNVCRCGAKHISKSKVSKNDSLGPLLDVEVSNKCMPLWREAHFEGKSVKLTFSDHFWPLRCRKSGRRCGAKHIFKSKVSKTVGSDHFWTVRCRFAWHAQGILHLVKSEQNVKVCSCFNCNRQYTTLHYTRLHSTRLHYTTLHYNTL